MVASIIAHELLIEMRPTPWLPTKRIGQKQWEI